MEILEKFDPELWEIARENMERVRLILETIEPYGDERRKVQAFREILAELESGNTAPRTAGNHFETEEVHVPRSDGDGNIRLAIFRPEGKSDTLPYRDRSTIQWRPGAQTVHGSVPILLRPLSFSFARDS